MTKRKKDDDGVLSTLGLRRPWDLGSSSCPGRLSWPPARLGARIAAASHSCPKGHARLRFTLRLRPSPVEPKR